MTGTIPIPAPLKRFSERSEKAHSTEGMATLTAGDHPADVQLAMETETARLWESINHMISSIAHGVKNPLGILLMGTDFLDKRISTGDAASARVLDDMRNAVGRVNGIVRALLDLTCAEAPAPQLEDVHIIVEAALEKVSRELAAKHIDVVRDYTDEEIPLDLDGYQIQQALTHLFANAIVAAPPGGVITVRTCWVPMRDRTTLQLTVHDNGGGVADNVLKRAFEPFFTTDKSGRKAGLGLTVARRIIESHGGRLLLGNKDSGGALATMVLVGPASNSSPVSASPLSSPPVLSCP